jgi:hypothetical protein
MLNILLLLEVVLVVLVTHMAVGVEAAVEF